MVRASTSAEMRTTGLMAGNRASELWSIAPETAFFVCTLLYVRAEWDTARIRLPRLTKAKHMACPCFGLRGFCRGDRTAIVHWVRVRKLRSGTGTFCPEGNRGGKFCNA